MMNAFTSAIIDGFENPRPEKHHGIYGIGMNMDVRLISRSSISVSIVQFGLCVRGLLSLLYVGVKHLHLRPVPKIATASP